MRRLRDSGARENKRYRFVAEGGSNRREGGLSTHWRKDTLVWNAKERNTRKGEERIEEESQIDVGATKIVRELRAKSSTGWKMRGRPGGKASDETNELDGRRRRLDQREKDEKL